MPVKRFEVPGHATRREFAVYVVLARKGDSNEFSLYVGKTGDNRDGCNPVISRAGNHFSYNDIHSQVRNKLENHEEYDYQYFYVTFDPYDEDDAIRRSGVDVVNEMERAVNEGVKGVLNQQYQNRLLNPYGGAGYIKKEEKCKRAAIRTKERMGKVYALITDVVNCIIEYAPDAIKSVEAK